MTILIRKMQSIRSKLFWALALATVGLAIGTVLFTRVTRLNPAEWGMMSKLPIIFWVGLLSVGLLLYHGRKRKNRLIFLCALSILFLFWVPDLIKEYSAEFPHGYYFASEAESILSQGHLVTNPAEPLIRYRNWPWFLYFEALMLEVTGIPPVLLVDLFQLANIALFALLVFLIFRVSLGTTGSLFGIIWFSASFWVGQQYCSPQAMSYAIYLMVFFLLVKQLYGKSLPKSRLIKLLVLFLLITTILSHPLTPFMLISVLIGICFLKAFSHKFNTQMSSIITIVTCALLTVIQVSYMLYITYPFWNSAMSLLRAQILSSEISPAIEWSFRILTLGSTYQIISVMSSRAIVAINVIFVILALKDRKTWIKNLFWIAWILGVGMIGLFVSYGIETHVRIYMFALVPLSFLCVSFLIRKPKVLCVVLFTLLLLHIPAHYAKDSWQMTTPTEMGGTSFFALYTQRDALYFYSSQAAILWYQDPARVNSIVYSGYNLKKLRSEPFNMSEFRKGIENVPYVMVSCSVENAYLYHYGSSPFDIIRYDTFYNRLYDSEHFLIYGTREAP